jgi:hypothetical protein
MNTARIVVLTIAVGAGGVAACPARGSDTSSAPAEPGARPQTAGTLSPAQYGITDLTSADGSGDPAPHRSSIKMIRAGVSTPAMAQK